MQYSTWTWQIELLLPNQNWANRIIFMEYSFLQLDRMSKKEVYEYVNEFIIYI